MGYEPAINYQQFAKAVKFFGTIFNIHSSFTLTINNAPNFTIKR